MIYDYFRVTGAHDTVLDYADLVERQFSVVVSIPSLVFSLFVTAVHASDHLHYH